jgi:small ligand-binding sensory domain FIST
MKDELINRLQYPICKGENIPWLGIYGGGELTPVGGKNQLIMYTSSLYVLVHKK